MWRRQRGARRRREMQFLTVRTLPIGRVDSRGGGSQNERVPCSQTQGGPWDLAVHPSLDKFRRPCSMVRKRGSTGTVIQTVAVGLTVRCLVIFCCRTPQPSLERSEGRARHI